MNINQLLNPRGLAYWIRDDGSIINKGLHLNVYGFSLDEVINLKIKITLENLFLLKGGSILKCSIQNHKKGYRLYISAESMLIVRDIIHQYQYMHKDRLYKINPNYNYNIYFDLLPYYAILRSIPNKLLGVLAMFGSLLILLVLPFTDLSRIRGNSFRPAMKLAFWFFVVDFFILMWIGSQHPNEPYVTIGQAATALYFAWFLIIVPAIGIFENTLMDVALQSKTSTNKSFN